MHVTMPRAFKDTARSSVHVTKRWMVDHIALDSGVFNSSIPHPDLIFVTLKNFKIDPLVNLVSPIRKDTYAPLPHGLSRECCIANIDIPQPLPTIAVVTIIGSGGIDSYPCIVALWRIVDSEAYWLIVIKRQYLDVR